MASEVDICNLALAHLGDTASVVSIEPPEGSAQAEHCARFFPIARDALLERHAWSFAMRREEAAELATPATGGWRHAYALPGDTLRVLAVLPAGAADEHGADFAVEDARILTRTPIATVRFVACVTDPGRWSPLFVQALAWQLASALAGPLIKGDAGAAMATRCLQMVGALISSARATDASQRSGWPDAPTPPWIAAR